MRICDYPNNFSCPCGCTNYSGRSTGEVDNRAFDPTPGHSYTTSDYLLTEGRAVDSTATARSRKPAKARRVRISLHAFVFFKGCEYFNKISEGVHTLYGTQLNHNSFIIQPRDTAWRWRVLNGRFQQPGSAAGTADELPGPRASSR
jgi:hypothetical protein